MNLEYPKKPSCPVLIAEGSEASINLAAMPLMDEDHQEMAFRGSQLAKGLGIQAAWLTLKEMMRKEHKIY